MTTDGDDHSTTAPTKTIRRIFRVVTRSGSVYKIAESNFAEFYVFSVALRPVFWWGVEAPDPWPPVIGHPLQLIALLRYAMDDPERMPGGGKITSPLTSIDEITFPDVA
jgi:hypothetical protein